MQDGSESGNTIEGNLGIMTRESYALAHSDTTPATFLISNPNNTVRFNRAAGSAGTGFWLRFLDLVEGRYQWGSQLVLDRTRTRMHACEQPMLPTTGKVHAVRHICFLLHDHYDH